MDVGLLLKLLLALATAIAGAGFDRACVGHCQHSDTSARGLDDAAWGADMRFSPCAARRVDDHGSLMRLRGGSGDKKGRTKGRAAERKGLPGERASQRPEEQEEASAGPRGAVPRSAPAADRVPFEAPPLSGREFSGHSPATTEECFGYRGEFTRYHEAMHVPSYPEEVELEVPPEPPEVIGQRYIPPEVESLLPGHETYKYYKDGHYTGEEMDWETADYWQKIANIYAPHWIGVPNIFLDTEEDKFGTLDWTLNKNRPETLLDERLKRTHWQPLDGEPQSLWRDGLIPIPDEDIQDYDIERLRAEMKSAGKKEKPLVIPNERRWLLPLLMQGIDQFRKEYKTMFKVKENVKAPYVHPAKLLLALLRTDWMLSDKSICPIDVYEQLKARNEELCHWNEARWRVEKVPADVLNLARKHKFFLGCTNSWMQNSGIRSGDRGTHIVGDVNIDGVGRLSSNVPVQLFQKIEDASAEESSVTRTSHAE